MVSLMLFLLTALPLTLSQFPLTVFYPKLIPPFP